MDKATAIEKIREFITDIRSSANRKEINIINLHYPYIHAVEEKEIELFFQDITDNKNTISDLLCKLNSPDTRLTNYQYFRFHKILSENLVNYFLNMVNEMHKLKETEVDISKAITMCNNFKTYDDMLRVRFSKLKTILPTYKLNEKIKIKSNTYA